MYHILFVAMLLIQVLFTQNATAAWETLTDRPGMDYKSFWIDKNVEAFVAVKQCEDACKNDSQCRAFTYVKAGIQGPNARCYLKKAVPAAVKNTCCTSGVVRPDTKADYCNNYALTAVQFSKSNAGWNCGYPGNRWSDNYQLHYNWCMKVQKSSSKHEADERKKLMDLCLKPSKSGDLSAYDWCYQLDKNRNNLSFYPVIKNEGKTNWQSKKPGEYYIGVTSSPGVMTEKKYTLGTFPHWYLESKKISILEGINYPYDPNYHYGIKNIWFLTHPEDTNIDNNSNPGFSGMFKGSAFENDPNIIVNKCEFYKKDNFWKKSGDVKNLNTHIILKSISVVDEADGSGNAEPYLWPFFFKIDSKMILPDNFYDPKKWTHTPGGEHGNVGKGYDTGQIRIIPAKYGQWKTTLTQNASYFPKDNVYVGAVVVLLEEDDLPSSNDVISKYYPEYTKKITKRLQCKFLKSMKEEVNKLKAKGDKTANLLKLVYDKLSQDKRAAELNCPNANVSVPKSDAIISQGFEHFVSEAEKELQEEVISATGDPWYLNFFIPGLSAFVNVDDFLGAKIFIWKWADLEKDPYQSFLIKWNDNSGSEDGSFNMRVHIRAYPIY